MNSRSLITTLGLCAVAGLGGYLASFTLLPLPYMLGALLTSGTIALFQAHHLPAGYEFPHRFRLIFMALVGVMIGAQVTPALLGQLPGLTLSMVALTVFTLMAQGGNYLMFRHIGGYDRTTALFSGAPGGLLESLAMGEERGADLQLLTMQQFLRIILVITLLPLGLSLWYGTPVGSAAGAGAAPPDIAWATIVLAVIVGLTGTMMGRFLHLPAGQLTGPLLAAALISVSGLAQLALPDWMIHMAQVVIGASLGLRFQGLRGRAMLRALWLSGLSVAWMLGLGLTLALLVSAGTGLRFDILLLSYAPGGVTEMALVALSLNANPALVTLHHVYRIFATVLAMGAFARWVLGSQTR
ncbi:AbrB family transcriptional regulator [Thalassobius sp. Cn5-15]|jgi:membrane AbrB-like protein|uniref:AbrB family transcriptional regulator n=1 Tax=Thalassobius sp. Cn5-15 TaxID=2917763 RepID=UPI001EF2EC35|nr:AbrB family transcriptional regulator [Thalassobius sp. Cn5-15]MCG7492704.1 AbrB family transcriptional regulator [Thalassobius sp. Cn5-15]